MNVKDLVIFTLCLFPFLAFADARLELSTGTVHAPWNPDNADQEHKLTGGVPIFTTQNADGTYSGSYYNRIEKVSKDAIEADLSTIDDGVVYFVSDCAQTAGTIVDDDGNEFTTNDCQVVVEYHAVQGWASRVDVDIYVKMSNAVASGAAEAVSQFPNPAGVSAAMR